jgi:two-component system, NtrC family, response regulator
MEFHFENIIGKSKAIRDVLEMVKKVAPTMATVLITGDSGTGKELIALGIHAHSDRKDKLFLPVNLRGLAGDVAGEFAFWPHERLFHGCLCQPRGSF